MTQTFYFAFSSDIARIVLRVTDVSIVIRRIMVRHSISFTIQKIIFILPIKVNKLAGRGCNLKTCEVITTWSNYKDRSLPLTRWNLRSIYFKFSTCCIYFIALLSKLRLRYKQHKECLSGCGFVWYRRSSHRPYNLYHTTYNNHWF